jgi:hypothetical protein
MDRACPCGRRALRRGKRWRLQDNLGDIAHVFLDRASYVLLPILSGYKQQSHRFELPVARDE